MRTAWLLFCDTCGAFSIYSTGLDIKLAVAVAFRPHKQKSIERAGENIASV